MKLDCLSNADEGRTIIRLYDFSSEDVLRLNRGICELASENILQFDVNDMLDVIAIDACKLTLLLKSRDQGVVRTGPKHFECGLSAGSWDNVSGLLEPFVQGSSGFQWLVDFSGDARLLISAGENW